MVDIKTRRSSDAIASIVAIGRPAATSDSQVADAAFGVPGWPLGELETSQRLRVVEVSIFGPFWALSESLSLCVIL